VVLGAQATCVPTSAQHPLSVLQTQSNICGRIGTACLSIVPVDVILQSMAISVQVCSRGDMSESWPFAFHSCSLYTRRRYQYSAAICL
jgi:hypothetical protein